MSLPENLRHGCAYLLPTPEFFLKEFCTNTAVYDFWHAYELCQEPRSPEKAVERLRKWTDWWQPEIEGAVRYFGSWEELVDAVRETDFERLRVAARDVMEGLERRTIQGWGEVLGLQVGERDGTVWRKEIACDKNA